MEFFLNVSLNSLNSLTKIFIITVKGLKPATSCVRDRASSIVNVLHQYITHNLLLFLGAVTR